MKICFLGAGSTVFAKNVLGDCILTESLGEFQIALHDIDEKRLDESYRLICAINKQYSGKATITQHLNRREALVGADYVINAIQVGGYKPATVTDFKIPKKYGLKQTIGDTMGVGGVMRGLRTIFVMQGVANDMEELCPNAWLLNYTNPMAIVTGYMQTFTKVKTVGLCHSVQSCVPSLLGQYEMKDKLDGASWHIEGINHQAWLLDIRDSEGKDLYPEIYARSASPKYAKRSRDLVRREIMRTFGFYVTESSEHNAEYMPYFIKDLYPGLISKYKIPLNEYPRRCRRQIRDWKKQSELLLSSDMIKHERSKEYGSRIIEALHTGKPFTFHGNVLNDKLYIPNLPKEACVEVPVLADKNGLRPIKCPILPEQCAALNRTNINVQLLALKTAITRSLKDLYIAIALDPHAASELSLEDIKLMCDELYEEHHRNGFLPEFSK